ncbi:MAG: hypothetical protein ACKOPO_08070 [Novosphingobium sp.]
MRIEITKGLREDGILICRDDGSSAQTTFPKKGPVPHDAVHWWVERELGLRNAFWGMVSDGFHPEAITTFAKEAGHASAKRARVPDATIVELLQAERLVECFEADLWSPGGSDVDFVDLAETACAYSHVPSPASLAPDKVNRIRGELASFAMAWSQAPQGHVEILEWE